MISIGLVLSLKDLKSGNGPTTCKFSQVTYENSIEMSNLMLFLCLPEYERWEGGEKNIGCIPSCTSEHALSLRSFYDSGKDQMFLFWNAHKREKILPYICQSKCPRGYEWFPGLKKCIGVYHSSESEEFTVGESILKCSLQNGRLFAPKTCADIALLADEVVDLFALPDQRYFIGLFTYKSTKTVHYRNWRKDKAYDS